MQTDTHYLVLNTRDELLRMDINSIVYFEADGNYTNIISISNIKGVICANLSKMQALLNEKLHEEASIFARVGKKYIINLRHVFSINTIHQQIVLSDGVSFVFKLQIGKDALKELKHILIKTSLQ